MGFVFSGNGCQWYAMGQQAALHHAGFGQSLARVDQLLQPLLGWSVCEEIQRPKAQSRIALTEVGQPVLFAIQVAIVEVLWQAGVVCEAVCGHSVGEVAAAWCAGLIDLPTACRIIVCRSRLQGLTHGDGGMAALAVDPATAFSYIEDGQDVHLAAVNSPQAVSLSGDVAELQRVVELAKADGHRAVVLDLPYAFHSPHMDALEEQLLEELGTVESHPSLCAFHSTVSSCHDGVQDVEAGYWWRNVREPVRFDRSIAKMVASGCSLFIEIGTHPILSHYVHENIRQAEGKAAVVSTLKREAPNEARLLSQALAECYVHGVTLQSTSCGAIGQRIDLPTYPWHRQRHWHWPAAEQSVHATGPAVSILGKRCLGSGTAWVRTIDPGLEPLWNDHLVDGARIFPVAGFIALMAAAAQAVEPRAELLLERVRVHQALVLQDHGAEIETAFLNDDGVVSIRTQAGTDWTIHAEGRVCQPRKLMPQPLAAMPSHQALSLSAADHYHRCQAAGLTYGPAFRGVGDLKVQEDTVWASISAEPGHNGIPNAAGLDACFQAVSGLLAMSGEERAYLPLRAERIRMYANTPAQGTVVIQRVRQNHRQLVVNLTWYDHAGMACLAMEGFRLQERVVVREGRPNAGEAICYRERWQAASATHAGGATATKLLAPAMIKERLDSTIVQLSEARQRHTYETTISPAMQQLCAGYVLQAMQRLGWNRHQPVKKEDLVARCGIIDAHHRVVGTHLRHLMTERMVQESEGYYQLTDLAQAMLTQDLDVLWQDLLTQYPEYHAELLLIMRFGKHLDGIFAGDVDPLQMMFDERSSAAEQVYATAPFARIGNELAAAALKEATRSLPASHGLRILEIGAGTGGTTSHVLPQVPEGSEYWFTDVGDTFLAKASQRFAGYPGIRWWARIIALAAWPGQVV